MDGTTLTILVIVGYLAATGLVQLMRAYRDRLLAAAHQRLRERETGLDGSNPEG